MGWVQGFGPSCSVLVVEKGRRAGGVSVHTGTIPSKIPRETVLNLAGWRDADSMAAPTGSSKTSRPPT